jgi:hypothetical protein
MGSDASVYIDGKFVGNVPQGQPTFTYRKVLFVAPFTQAGYHTIEILFGQGIELDIDAFVVDHG